MNFFLKRFDWQLNIAVGFLLLMSLIMLSSINTQLFWRQVIWIGLAFLFGSFLIIFDWRPFENYKWVVYGIYGSSLLFLALTLVLAPKVKGHASWIPIGPFQFQASTLASFALIIVLANFFRKKHKSIARISTLAGSFIYFLLPAVLTALQPDSGSILLMFSIWFGFILVSGISWKHLLVIILSGLIIFAIGWNTFLKDYQKERIVGLFFPNKDVLGINYNVIQAKITIGSSGFFGKGYKQGTQVHLGFLPEPHTDFIFSSIMEEWGFLSGILIIGSFCLIIWRIISIGIEERNNFNKFICLGTAIFFTANFLFNTGSNVGLLPVVGVPFPFLSYGGSHLLFELLLISMIQTIHIRK